MPLNIAGCASRTAPSKEGAVVGGLLEPIDDCLLLLSSPLVGEDVPRRTQ